MTIQQLHPLSFASPPRQTEAAPPATRSACGNCGQAACGGGEAARTTSETGTVLPSDELSITTEAQTLATERLGRSQPASLAANTEQEGDAPEHSAGAQKSEKTEPASSQDFLKLSDEELEQLTDLRDRDRQVRAHEQAHLAADSKTTGVRLDVVV